MNAVDHSSGSARTELAEGATAVRSRDPWRAFVGGCRRIALVHERYGTYGVGGMSQPRVSRDRSSGRGTAARAGASRGCRRPNGARGERRRSGAATPQSCSPPRPRPTRVRDGERSRRDEGGSRRHVTCSRSQSVDSAAGVFIARANAAIRTHGGRARRRGAVAIRRVRGRHERGDFVDGPVSTTSGRAHRGR